MNEESLFIAALELKSDAGRNAFLEAACAGDDALRQRVVRLLSAHEKTLGILDQSAGPGPAGAWPETHVSAPTGIRVGTLLGGRYKLLEEIGAGGMGTVWKAEQLQPLRRTVAVKLIHSGMNSRTVLARFEAERQALARMDHPNIAKVLDGGTTEGGRPYFVMEYVKGVPFTDYCDNACLTIEDRLALFVPVCRAVQHAHTKGVIHRDLKPSNILICLYDGRPVPKVIDFGLAKAIQEPLTDRTLHTAHGVLLGTPLYMSPEQAEFNNLDVDTRTDIYALGAILYELLTGTTPLERQRFQAAAWHELIRVLKEEDPPRPSARLSSSNNLPSVAAQRQLPPVRLTRLVRGELDWIVMKCIEKDRARRYETANSLARDVERYLNDESVEACPPSTHYRVRKFVRRNRSAVAVGLTILVLLLTTIVGTASAFMRARRAWKAEAQLSTMERKANEQAQKRLKQIERSSEILYSVFEELDPRAEEQEGRPLRAILADRLSNAAQQLKDEEIGDPLLVADLQYRLGLSLLRLGLPTNAIRLFEQCIATRTKLLGANDEKTLTGMSALAEGYHADGDLDRALPLLEETLQRRRVVLGDRHPHTLFSMHNLAAGYRATSQMARAVPLLEETLKLRAETLGKDHEDTLSTMNSLGLCYQAENQLDRAGPLLEETLELRKAKLGPDHPDTMNSMNSLAIFYLDTGKRDEALSLLEQTYKLRKAKLGADHPDTLITMNNLAAGYKAIDRIDLAIPLLEENLKLSIAKRGPENPYTLRGMNNLAWIYRETGKRSEALKLFTEAAAILEKRAFVDEFSGNLVNNLINTLDQAKQFTESERWRRSWRSAVETKSGADSVPFARESGALGENLLHQQKWADAAVVLREALAVFEKKLPDSLPRFYAQAQLGIALLHQKEYAKAEPLLVAGYEGLKAHAAQAPQTELHRISEIGEEIVALYEAWGKPGKAGEWRGKLAAPSVSPVKPSP